MTHPMSIVNDELRAPIVNDITKRVLDLFVEVQGRDTEDETTIIDDDLGFAVGHLMHQEYRTTGSDHDLDERDKLALELLAQGVGGALDELKRLREAARSGDLRRP